ncbi:MAG: MarR family transcriptional regulator [Rhizobiaceae bacterium]|jgi:DNA-binding MarR family transcriptional regulator|nr:MarR family transcriptional regulator [Rhizobiaceae bacterium]
MPNELEPGAQDDGAALLPLTRLFELSARSLHSAGHSHGLYPAQWSALRYLASADPGACTSSALARFQQLAVGPVTRTVRTLIEKGLVRKAGMGLHHRSDRLELTEQGVSLLEQDPLRAIDAVLRGLGDEDAKLLAGALGRIMLAMQLVPPLDTDGAVDFDATFSIVPDSDGGPAS